MGQRGVNATEGQQTRVRRRDLVAIRRMVIDAIEKGHSPEEVAEIVNCGRSTVYGWIAAYRDRGDELFQVKAPSGRPPLLTNRQMNQLRKWIVGKDPRQLRFEFALWTREMVRDLIFERYAVQMTLQGVGKVLHRLGLSAQRPLVRAYEQDPERVRRFKEEEFPEIVKRAKEIGAQIFFSDEAGVRSDFHSGTTWGEVGHTPIVRSTGQRRSLNMISAVSAKGKLHFTFVEGKVTADAFIGYLKKLLHDINGKIVLIVDGHPAHKATKVRQFVEQTNGRLELYLLPPYSPELNPDK